MIEQAALTRCEGFQPDMAASPADGLRQEDQAIAQLQQNRLNAAQNDPAPIRRNVEELTQAIKSVNQHSSLSEAFSTFHRHIDFNQLDFHKKTTNTDKFIFQRGNNQTVMRIRPDGRVTRDLPSEDFPCNEYFVYAEVDGFGHLGKLNEQHRAEGFGIRKLENGYFYIGNFHQNEKHGQCILFKPTDFIIGRYENNRLVEGEGFDLQNDYPFQLTINPNNKPNDPILSKQLKKSNFAQTTYKDGAKFIGEAVAGMPHGYGVEVSPNGDVFAGEFHSGTRHRGILTGAMQFEGEWKDAQFSFGKVVKEGATYIGDWKNGAHGHGILEQTTDHDRQMYLGEFKEGHFSSGTHFQFDQNYDLIAKESGTWNKEESIEKFPPMISSAPSQLCPFISSTTLKTAQLPVVENLVLASSILSANPENSSYTLRGVITEQGKLYVLTNSTNSEGEIQNQLTEVKLANPIQKLPKWPVGICITYLGAKEVNGTIKHYFHLLLKDLSSYRGSVRPVAPAVISPFMALDVGKRTYTDGSFYDGEWDGFDAYQGLGLRTFPQRKGTLLGHWKNNLPENTVAVFENGDLYLGDSKKGEGTFIQGTTMRSGKWVGGIPHLTQTSQLSESNQREVTPESFVGPTGLPFLNENSNEEDRQMFQEIADAYNRLRNSLNFPPEERNQIRKKACEMMALFGEQGKQQAELFASSYAAESHKDQMLSYKDIYQLVQLALQKSKPQERLNQSRALRALLLHYCHANHVEERDLALDQYWCSLLFPCGYAHPYESQLDASKKRKLSANECLNAINLYLCSPPEEQGRKVTINHVNRDALSIQLSDFLDSIHSDVNFAHFMRQLEGKDPALNFLFEKEKFLFAPTEKEPSFLDTCLSAIETIAPLAAMAIPPLAPALAPLNICIRAVNFDPNNMRFEGSGLSGALTVASAVFEIATPIFRPATGFQSVLNYTNSALALNEITHTIANTYCDSQKNNTSEIG